MDTLTRKLATAKIKVAKAIGAIEVKRQFSHVLLIAAAVSLLLLVLDYSWGGVIQ
ncbi:MAG: hypothetical protein M9928_22620 [Anaerolineae bacterium]|nr:hypothetical protein [Anaerolineae bacterium]MCO5190385.1 hypothetical protein [Anaerolineae bacterium]MCO5192862.1 hypothetical protein [Anaerolineae bacterium]MCO5207808.1 hypothetical protein [Anaerolineae bacterium]